MICLKQLSERSVFIGTRQEKKLSYRHIVKNTKDFSPQI